MKKFDRFLLKAFIGPFVAILLVVLFVLMMQFLWVYIDELVGKGLGFSVIAEFLMWGSCYSLPLALPLATLLSSMMTIGQLAENNELMAIKSAGISLGRVLLPLILASVVISIGALFTSDDLVPYAYNKILTLRDDIGKTKEEIKIPSGTFYDGIDGYILRVEDSGDSQGMMYGIMVYDHTGRQGNTTISLADSATIRMAKTKDYITFTMYSGANYQETNQYEPQDTTRQLERINFDRQEMIIPLEHYAFQKSDEARFGDQTKSKKLKDLYFTRDSLVEVAAELHTRHVLQMMTSPQIAKIDQLDSAGLAKGLPNFPEEYLTQWKSDYEPLVAAGKAESRMERLISDMKIYEQETYDCNYFLRRSELEIYKRYSGALACFILFFIGAPLGALIRKGGLGASAIVSVLFFVLYWVVDITGTKLARDGAIDPFSGAFISAYVLAPIGTFLTWKAIHDSSFFAADNMKAWWRRVKSRIRAFFRKPRIVYMGTPEFAVAPLDALVRKGFKIVGVVTVADKPSGRGLKMNESAVKQYAVAHDIPVLQPLKLKDPEFLDALRAWNADLFVVVAFRMLPEEIWSMPKFGTFNLHAALLPQYRGAAPINWAVINGERMTGVTTFMIDKDIDTGGILFRSEARIAGTDTAGDVHDRLMALGSDLVVQTAEAILEGNAETRVQRSFIQGSEVLKPAPKLTRELCRLDWSDTTRHLYNLIRGLSPYPTAFTTLTPIAEKNIFIDSPVISSEAEKSPEPVTLKIFFAEKVEGAPAAAPGTVTSDGKTWLHIATGDGALSVTDVQLSGKKRMGVQDFLRGFRDPESYIAQ